MTRYMPSVIRIMRETVDEEPDDLRARFNLVLALMELSRFRDALEEVEELIGREPSYERGAVFSLKGVCCARLRWYDDAANAFNEALNHGAPEVETRIQLAHNYIATKQFDQAEETLQLALNASTSSLTSASTAGILWSEIGKVRFDAGDLDGSDAAFFRASQYAPKSPEPWIRRAKFYIDRGESERALRSAERAQSIFPGNPDAMLVYAEALLQSGDEDAAQRLIENGGGELRALVRRRPTTFWMFEEE